MTDDNLIADLIAAGTPPMLVQRVAMEVMRAQIEREALEKRKEQDRDRQSRRRRGLSRDITSSHGQTVTARDVTPSPTPSPVPPNPLNPNPTPGSEAVASAAASAAPIAAKLEPTISDRVWTEFPAVLADIGKRSEDSVRKWIGKLLAKFDAADVHHALSETVAAGTGDPFGYSMRLLTPIRPKARASPRRSPADLWAADAVDAHQELNGGRDDKRPFHTDAGSRGRPGEPDARRSHERDAEPAGGDPRQLPALRVVGSR